MGAKIKESVIEKTVSETGELKEYREKMVVSWGQEPPYVKLYLNDILYFSDMPKAYEPFMYELLRYATYADEEEGMVVTLSAYIKSKIQKRLDIKRTETMDNYLYKLTKGGLLKRLGTGTYQFNPYLFGKGDWADIARLRLDVSYDIIKGRTFKGVIEYKKGKEEAQKGLFEPQE